MRPAKHRATTTFWRLYRSMPEAIQQAADRQYRLLRANPQHPSLRLKPVGRGWSARVTSDYRVLGRRQPDGTFVWIWIGSHAEYDKLIR